jgi:hypothetical protein
MQILKLLRQEAARLVHRARTLSSAALLAIHRRRQQPALEALEAERIDRIRNPTKYLGKS